MQVANIGKGWVKGTWNPIIPFFANFCESIITEKYKVNNIAKPVKCAGRKLKYSTETYLKWM